MSLAVTGNGLPRLIVPKHNEHWYGRDPHAAFGHWINGFNIYFLRNLNVDSVKTGAPSTVFPFALLLFSKIVMLTS